MATQEAVCNVSNTRASLKASFLARSIMVSHKRWQSRRALRCRGRPASTSRESAGPLERDQVYDDRLTQWTGITVIGQLCRGRAD